MALKTTLEDTQDRLEALLTYANSVTGASDTSLGDAIETLANGYGQGGGEQIYYSPSGQMYYENMEVPIENYNNEIPSYNHCTNMVNFSAPNFNVTKKSNAYQIGYNDNLETLFLPKWQNVGNFNFSLNPKLKRCQLGSIGYPVTTFNNANATFNRMTQSDLTITIYVDASSIADISTNITANQPWGATNATIIYRSSTTGEVLS